MDMAAFDHPVTTLEELHALPEDEFRHELLDGVHLVTPTPDTPHESIAFLLAMAIGPYTELHAAGACFIGHGAVRRSPGTELLPDLLVLPLEGGRRPRDWSETLSPILVVEVLSLGSARYDRGPKREKYQEIGAQEYWIFDPDARLVERWRPDDRRPEIITDSLAWQPNSAIPPLRIDLPVLFARAFGEV